MRIGPAAKLWVGVAHNSDGGGADGPGRRLPSLDPREGGVASVLGSEEEGLLEREMLKGSAAAAAQQQHLRASRAFLSMFLGDSDVSSGNFEPVADGHGKDPSTGLRIIDDVGDATLQARLWVCPTGSWW